MDRKLLSKYRPKHVTTSFLFFPGLLVNIAILTKKVVILMESSVKGLNIYKFMFDNVFDTACKIWKFCL